jgi:flagellar biosynthesis protein
MNADNPKDPTGTEDPQGNLRRIPDTKDAIAVALAEGVAGAAPNVVAGGRGRIAEQILQIAFANGIKVREDADLAELLSTIEMEEEIPVEAFAAVAEILIYLYRANGADDEAAKSREEIVGEWMGRSAE